jgi:hypothetical protein
MMMVSSSVTMSLLLLMVVSPNNTRHHQVQAFSVTRSRSHCRHHPHHSLGLGLKNFRAGLPCPSSSSCLELTILPDNFNSGEDLLLLASAAEEPSSWRQYVPLVVSVGIIIDILLGSPLANMVMAPLRGAAAEDDSGRDGGRRDSNTNIASETSKERIDSEKVAAEALAKASATLELRKFLDESKSDWQKMEEQKRDLDKQMQALDDDLARRQQDLDSRTK